MRLNVSGQVKGGGGGGRDEVWDQEMMFSQLAKHIAWSSADNCSLFFTK